MTTMTSARNRRRTPVALLAAAAGLSACDRDISTPLANEALQTLEADYVAYGMLSFITASGVREGRVEADTAYVYEDTKTALLKQMTIVFYDEYGAERATVSGREGDWSTESNRMSANGDVVLFIHSDSSTIESAEMHYDQELDRVWSDSTTIQRYKDGSVFSGTSFESDMTFERISIRGMRGGLPTGR